MIAYKFLRPGGTSPFTGFAWPQPDGGPGPWLEAPVGPGPSGIHACRRDDLPLWLGRELYEVELDGEIVDEPAKLIAPPARAWCAASTPGTTDCARSTRACAPTARTSSPSVRPRRSPTGTP